MTATTNVGVPGKDYIGVGVGAVILNPQGEILLLKRSRKLPKERTTVGMWSIPGGEVNFGEKIEAALAREVWEELGVRVRVTKLIGHWDQILPKTKIHWHCISFLCAIRSGTPTIREPEKFDDLKWFPLSHLPKDAGIAHVAAPLFLLGKISRDELRRRIRETPES